MMAKKKEHYGVLIIVGIVLLIAVAFIYFSGGTFGQAVANPEKYARCMQDVQNMKNKLMEAESAGKTISPSKYEKYGDLLAKCQSLLPKKPETYESCFSEYENKARDYKIRQDYPSAERIFQEGLKVCGEKFGKPAEAKPCPPCKECPACPTPTHIMSENERQTWTVRMPNGNMNEFDVELLVVSETSSEAKFKINGEITEPLKRGDGYNLNDGSVFVITAIKGSQVEAAILPFSVLLR